MAGQEAHDAKPRPRVSLSVITGIATLVGVVVAVAAAIIALEQANIANEQNQGAEQQELVTLVGDLTQNRGALSTAHGASSGPIEDSSLADASQAAALINALDNHARRFRTGVSRL